MGPLWAHMLKGHKMDFAEMMRVLRRRWRVSVPLLVLTMIATAWTYVSWPATYQSTAEITLIGPRSLASQPSGGDNPYLGVGGLGPMAGILAGNLSSQQSAQELRSLGVSAAFKATVPPFAAGPFVELSLSGTDPSAIRGSMPVVLSFAARRLAFIQESGPVKTPQKGLVRDVVIAQPNSPAPVLKTKIEVVAGVAIIGFLLLFLLSFTAEGRAERKDRARDAEAYGDGRGVAEGRGQPLMRRTEVPAR